ncbi:MAG: SDR family oxidoreductase [Pseudomonadota bacterium]
METALITGANRGVGLALAQCFLEADYRVIAACRKPAEAHELRELGDASVLSIEPLEVTDEQSVLALAEKLAEQPLDILINNAGVMGHGDSGQGTNSVDYDAWRDAFETNTIAPFRIISALKNNLSKADRPRAITISSQMGSLNRKSKGSYAYRSTKAAVNKLMQVLALELADEGIIVCPVHPGWVRTDMGGPTADISVEESATGLFKLISSITMEQSGRFWTWAGEEHPW